MAQQAATISTSTATTTNTNANQSSTNNTTLYPVLESSIAPLDTSEKYKEIIKIEKELCSKLKQIVATKNLLDDLVNTRIFPSELTSNEKKTKSRTREDIVKKLKELPTDDAEEDEEQQEDEEENSDEEEKVIDEEEDEAGGDYIMSHFDNGEAYEDNDEDGDDMNSVI